MNDDALLSTTVEFTSMRAILLGSLLDCSETARERSECFGVALGAERVARPLGRTVRPLRAAAAGRALSGGPAECGGTQERLATGRASRRCSAVAHATGALARAVGRRGGARPVSRVRGRVLGRSGGGADR